MEPRKRLWIGATLMAVIIFNYILIGAPLLSKSYSINQKTKAILVKQIRSSGIFNNMDDILITIVEDSVRTKIYNMLNKEKIGIPYPTTTVYMADKGKNKK